MFLLLLLFTFFLCHAENGKIEEKKNKKNMFTKSLFSAFFVQAIVKVKKI
jgi:hypothetical protein